MPLPTPQCPLDLQGARRRLNTVQYLPLTVRAFYPGEARDKLNWNGSNAGTCRLWSHATMML